MPLTTISNRLTLFQILVVALSVIVLLLIAAEILVEDIRDDHDARLVAYSRYITDGAQSGDVSDSVAEFMQRRSYSSELASDPPWAYIVAPDGSLEWASDSRPVATAAFRRFTEAAPETDSGFVDAEIEGVPYRLYRNKIADGFTLTVVYSWDDLKGPLAHVEVVVTLLFLHCMLIVGIGSHLLVRRLLRPIEEMLLETELVREKGLETALSSRSVDRPGAESEGRHRDEVSRLQRSFNEMLNRLRDTIESEHSFIAERAHDIIDPLTVLGMELEIGSLDDIHADDQERHFRALRQVDEIREISTDLILLARFSVDAQPALPRPVSMSDLLLEISGNHATTMTRKGVSIHTDFPEEEEIIAQVDPHLFERLVGKIVSTLGVGLQPGAVLGIQLRSLPNYVVVTIGQQESSDRDAEASTNALVDPFRFTVIKGLRIAQEIVRLHGGAITYSRVKQKHDCITLYFPREPRA